MGMYERVGKRLFDIAASSAALVVLSPLLLAVAAAVRLEDGGSPFYVSERVGRDGKPFRFYKFRSMPVDAPSVPSSEARTLVITRVGRLIRRTNIDELPQLLNILRGDMSVVGPRPGIARQAELIELRRANRALACRPGLTGLAQVESYDGMTDDAKAGFDGRYAERVTFGGDVRILVRTLGYLTKPPPVY
jgi:O-antigen biosynthesis protein WbqP